MEGRTEKEKRKEGRSKGRKEKVRECERKGDKRRGDSGASFGGRGRKALTHLCSLGELVEYS